MDDFEFEVDSLYSKGIEKNILKHYGLGIANSSDVSGLSKDEQGVFGPFFIWATGGQINFDLIIGIKPDGKYNITCCPSKIKRSK